MKRTMDKSGGLRQKLLASSVLAAMMAAMPMSMVQAQDVERVTQDADEDEDAVQDTIVVTGSRLTEVNITSSSPVSTLDADAFRSRGTIDVVDLVNTLPSAIAGPDQRGLERCDRDVDFEFARSGCEPEPCID